MLKKAIGVLLAAVAVLALWYTFAPKSPEFIVRDAMWRHGATGAVLSYGRAGEPPRIVAFGDSSAETAFPIASVTKTITAAMAREIAAEGLIDLDAPASLFLPELLSAKDTRHQEITARQLMNHTAGFSREVLDCPAESGPKVTVGVLSFDPGARFEYSNLGYCLLGILIERATGEGYEALVSRSRLLSGLRVEVGNPAIMASGGLATAAKSLHMILSRVSPSTRTAEYVDGLQIYPNGYGHNGFLEEPPSSIIAVRTDNGAVVIVQFTSKIHPSVLIDMWGKLVPAVESHLRQETSARP